MISTVDRLAKIKFPLISCCVIFPQFRLKYSCNSFKVMVPNWKNTIFGLRVDKMNLDKNQRLL